MQLPLWLDLSHLRASPITQTLLLVSELTVWLVVTVKQTKGFFFFLLFAEKQVKRGADYIKKDE